LQKKTFAVHQFWNILRKQLRLTDYELFAEETFTDSGQKPQNFPFRRPNKRFLLILIKSIRDCRVSIKSTTNMVA